MAVLLVGLGVEAEIAGHDPYCYWDACFPSRSFVVYGQHNYCGNVIFQDQVHNLHSSLSCWVGPMGLPHLCSKTSNVVWAVLLEMLCFRTIFLNESCIAIRCQQLSNEGQPNTLTFILVQQTS